MLGVAVVGAGEGAVVAGVCVAGAVCTPGGFCGAVCCVPGGVCGFAGGFGRAVGGTVCCCSVPGGRVASVCAGVVEGGVVGFCVEDCALSAVETTKGSPIFLKTGLRATAFAFGCGAGILFAASEDLSAGVADLSAGDVDLSAGDGEVFAPALSDATASDALARGLSAAAAFPKADTAFPKTRNAERQAAQRAFDLARAGSNGLVCLCIFST